MSTPPLSPEAPAFNPDTACADALAILASCPGNPTRTVAGQRAILLMREASATGHALASHHLSRIIAQCLAHDAQHPLVRELSDRSLAAGLPEAFVQQGRDLLKRSERDPLALPAGLGCLEHALDLGNREAGHHLTYASTIHGLCVWPDKADHRSLIFLAMVLQRVAQREPGCAWRLSQLCRLGLPGFPASQADAWRQEAVNKNQTSACAELAVELLEATPLRPATTAEVRDLLVRGAASWSYQRLDSRVFREFFQPWDRAWTLLGCPDDLGLEAERLIEHFSLVHPMVWTRYWRRRRPTEALALLQRLVGRNCLSAAWELGAWIMAGDASCAGMGRAVLCHHLELGAPAGFLPEVLAVANRLDQPGPWHDPACAMRLRLWMAKRGHPEAIALIRAAVAAGRWAPGERPILDADLTTPAAPILEQPIMLPALPTQVCSVCGATAEPDACQPADPHGEGDVVLCPGCAKTAQDFLAFQVEITAGGVPAP